MVVFWPVIPHAATLLCKGCPSYKDKNLCSFQGSILVLVFRDCNVLVLITQKGIT